MHLKPDARCSKISKSFTITSFTLKLGEDFLHVPKLASDGKNWVIYKDRLTLSVHACGLRGHLDGTTTKPMEPAVTQAPADRELTEEKEEKIATYRDNFKEWFQKEAIVSQQVASLYLKIRGKPVVKEAWNLLKSDFEKKSQMFMVDVRQRLQDERCNDNANVHAHFDTMHTMHGDLAVLGMTSMTRTSVQCFWDHFPSHMIPTSLLLKHTSQRMRERMSCFMLKAGPGNH